MIRQAFAVAFLSVSVLSADVALIDLVPAESKMIGGIHVDRALSSSIGQYFLDQVKEDDASFRKFIETTGFDPRQHLRDVVVASGTEGRKNGLLLARGVFNGPQILAAAQAHGGTVTTYKGVQLLETTGRRASHAIVILDGTLAIAGEGSLVRAAIDRRASGGSAASPLAARAASMDSSYDAWFVGNGVPVPAAKPRPGSTPPPTAALAAIQETGVGVQFGSVVRLNAEAVTRSEKDAQALVDVAKFLAGMLQLNRNNDPNFQRFEAILNSMDIRAEAATVKLTLAVPDVDLLEILKSKQNTRRAAR